MASPLKEPYTKFGNSVGVIPVGMKFSAKYCGKRSTALSRHFIIVSRSVREVKFVTSEPTDTGISTEKICLRMVLRGITVLSFSIMLFEIPSPPSLSRIIRKNIPAKDERVIPRTAIAEQAVTSSVPSGKYSRTHGFSAVYRHSPSPQKSLTSASMSCETAVGYIFFSPS